MKYKIIYTEKIAYEFFVDADDRTKALDEFFRKWNNGDFTFDDGEIADSDTIVEEAECDATYTAIIYEEDMAVTADMSMYDDMEEAISFAKSHNWDEVVNDVTGEVVWKRK